ncbi:MAG: ribonuclease H-like domain-containing protein [bacterium]
MKEKLAARLKRLQSTGSPSVTTAYATRESERSAADRQASAELANLGFEQRDSFVWCRTSRHEVSEASRERLQFYQRSGLILAETPGPYVFVDTETTGLGFGAGTIAFLSGFGVLSDDGTCTLRQFLLTDYPGEPSYLAHIAEYLTPESCVVSYNGKSFDLNVLQTRFLMNAIPWTKPRQLDLLYPVRRLYRSRLPRCNLSTVERDLLGVQRNGDIPGAEVPERYFTFLQTGVAEVLRPVITHHEQDIVSLVRLLVFIEEDLASAGANRRADTVALARMLMAQDPAKAEELLHEHADPARPFGDSRRAMIALAGVLKRTGRSAEAVPLWRSLYRPGGSLTAGIELAKYYEHRARAPEAALEICLQMRSRATTGALVDSLDHRIGRLSRRLRNRESER